MRSAFGGGGFGAAQQSFAEGELVGGRHAGQGVQERLGGGWVADAAQGPGGGLGDLVIGSVQQLGQELDGLGVAAHADAADDADERPALELAGRVAQGLVHRGIRDGLQPIAGHVGEFLVGQERGQRGDGVLGADAGQFAAGIGFLLLGGVGFEDGDEFLDLVCGRGLGGSWRRRRRRRRTAARRPARDE